MKLTFCDFICSRSRLTQRDGLPAARRVCLAAAALGFPCRRLAEGRRSVAPASVSDYGREVGKQWPLPADPAATEAADLKTALTSRSL